MPPRSTPFQKKHEHEYGLEISAVDADGAVESVRCRFCVVYGREQREEGSGKRKRTTNIKTFTKPFRPEFYRYHLSSQHTKKWQEFQSMSWSEKAKLFPSGAGASASALGGIEGSGSVNGPAAATRAPLPKPFLVHEAAAHSRAIMSLVGTLRDTTTTAPRFQLCATRLARLLVEDTLTRLPQEQVEIASPSGDVCHALKPVDERDLCAVTMETGGLVLLRAFSEISPASPTGVISVEATEIQGDDPTGLETATSMRVQAQVPRIWQRFVLVLDIECATGKEVCAALGHLVRDKSVPEASIYYVTIVSCFEGLQAVHQEFPDVVLVTATMDSVLDQEKRIRPGMGDFMKRYWNVPSTA